MHIVLVASILGFGIVLVHPMSTFWFSLKSSIHPNLGVTRLSTIAQTSFSLTSSSSTSSGTILSHPKVRWDTQSLYHVQGLFLSLLPVGHAQINPTKLPSDVWVLSLISKDEPSSVVKETYLGLLNLQPHSFDHWPKLMFMSEVFKRVSASKKTSAFRLSCLFSFSNTNAASICL